MTDTKDTDRKPAAFPWGHEASEVVALLRSRDAGLSDQEAEKRLKAVGPNEFKRERGARAGAIFLKQFTSPLIFVLLAAAGITILLNEWVETVMIFLAVFVNAILGFYQEYRAEHTLEKLTNYIKERARVVRGGEEREIESAELVPGDIVKLVFGARVPADARIIESTNLAVDESFLTGESLPVKKAPDVVSEGAGVVDRTNMIFAGALVVEGSALAVVTGTGESTEIGRIAKLVKEAQAEPTPLQRSLARLAWVIFAGAAVIVSGLFFLGISRGEPLLDMLLLSVATAVGTVPEALPIALTVILAVGVERIARNRGIVRSLSAAETLGSTTVVMTDKTGTLTQAKMRVTGILTATQLRERAIVQPTNALKLTPEERSILADALLATEVVVENPHEDSAKWRFLGKPLEINIGLEAVAAGVDVLALTRERRQLILPFNSTKKFAMAFDTKMKHAVILGAPDILLARSDISKDDYIAMESHIQTLATEGKRLVGVARLSGTHAHRHATGKTSHDDVEHLEFLGVLVLYDPVRPEAKGAVRRIEAHGARVVMLTGDLKGTAMAIARELGWQVSEGNVLSGNEVRELSDDDLVKRLKDIKIFARVTPEDKMRIGRLYQKSGEVVAMTGDGVNDAPSLKAMDIGIAIGSGSDVAKAAGDLVLLDDNFETIVLAIEEGRRIIANIRKAFVYLMSNCLDEVFVIGGALIFALPLPLTAMQIIWVNFFTGSLPALAYAFEENRDVSSRGRNSIFSAEVQVLTVGIGILTSLLLFVLYWGLLRLGIDTDTARTVFFLCFATYILAVSFSFKSLHLPLFSYPFFDNRSLNVGLAVATVLTILSIAVPFFRDLLDLAPISFMWIGFVVLWLAFNVALIELTKLFFRLWHNRA